MLTTSSPAAVAAEGTPHNKGPAQVTAEAIVDAHLNFSPEKKTDISPDVLATRKRYAEKKILRYRRIYEAALERVIDQEKREGEASRSRRLVEFRLQYHTYFGQTVAVVGSSPALGSWNVACAVKLHWTDGNIWVGKVTLNYDCKTVEYKYIVFDAPSARKHQPGHPPVIWEPGSNHVIDLDEIPPRTMLTLEDHWGAGGLPPNAAPGS